LLVFFVCLFDKDIVRGARSARHQYKFCRKYIYILSHFYYYRLFLG